MEDGIEKIRANARMIIETLGPISEIEFGYNRESIQYVTKFIEGQRTREVNLPNPPSTLVSTLGSFVGECIIFNIGGKWEWSEKFQTFAISFKSTGKDFEVFPFNKIWKQFANGVEGGDSVLGLYDVVVDSLAKGKFDNPKTITVERPTQPQAKLREPGKSKSKKWWWPFN